MPLRMAVHHIAGVERAAASGLYHEVLAVMPPDEAHDDGWLRWPRIALPRFPNTTRSHWRTETST